MAPNVDPLRVLRRHMFLLIFMAVFGAGLGFGAFFVLSRTYPLYDAQAMFQIRPGLSESSDFGTDDSNLTDEDVARQAETESVMLTSREVILEGLKNSEINTTTWFEKFKSPDGTFNYEEAADDLEEELSAGLVRGTLFFRLSWTTTHKDDAPVIVNAIANAYYNLRIETESATWDDNLLEFDGRLDQINREIESVQGEIERFILDRGITVLDNMHFSQTARTLETLATQLAGAEAERMFADTQLQQTRAKLTGTLEPTQEDYLEAEQDPVVMPLARQVVDLQTALRLLRGKYPDDNFQVQEAISRLNAAKAEKEAKVDEVVQLMLNARHKVLSDQVESYDRQIERLEAEVREYDERMTQLAADQAEYQSKVTQREQLEASRESTRNLVHEIELLKVRNDARRVAFVHEARTPRELAFPKIATMIPLGFVLCVGLTLGIIFLRELTDQRIKSASDVEVVPGASVLGVIPDASEDPTRVKRSELVVSRQPKSVLAESYRQVAAPVLRAIDLSGHQVVMMTSGLPGAGTSTTIGNLATSMAASGRKVLVIDANFRRPTLGSMFGISADGPGFGDLLGGDAAIADVAHETEAGPTVITAGTPSSRIMERLNMERFDALLAECRSRYDLVLIDTPPAVVAGDAFVVANKVDAAVLVVRAYKEHRGLLSRLINQFSAIQCELLGTVLNRPRTTVGGYFKKNFDTMAKYAEKSRAKS